MRRILRGLALAIGYPAAILLVLGTLALAARYAQARFFHTPLAPERMDEKRSYLAGIAPVDPATAPNFVVILFDDLGWGDLSSYGNRLIRTPRTDRLAAQGVRMTDFYSAAPVCTPSRAALLTGRYAIRSRTHHMVFFSEASPVATLRRMLGLGNELMRDEVLVSEALSTAGYATGMVGKWHLGGVPGHRPNDFGFASWYGVLWSNDMTPLHLYRDGEIEERDTRNPGTWTGTFRNADTDRGDGLDQRTLTERYTREAVAFIERNRERPFFLLLSHTFPHVPHFASREYAGSSPGGVYGDVVEDLDRSVGAVVDALDRLGLGERTLVIVTSDNGADYNGSPGFLRGRKASTYEGGQRVPMIARWSGRIPAGLVSDELGMNTDIFPTLLGQAGIRPPSDREIDGRDLMPILERGAPSAHDVLFYTSAWTGEVDAVRDRRFKYRATTADFGRNKPQLWRMDADAEAHNLIALHAADAGRLAGRLEAQRAALAENPRGWRGPDR
jgi:arylsulfatase A-like enzyme